MSREVLRIQDEMFAMPEWGRLQRINGLQRSIRLLEGNARELLASIALLTTDRRSMELMAVENRWKLDAALEEPMRLLHNFVASVLSLIDHSRVLTNELYPQGRGFPEYQTEVDKTFAKNPLARFVKELRQFAQHYALPHVGFTAHFVNGDGGATITRTLQLSKRQLREFSGWSSVARAFMNSQPENFDFSEIVSSYVELVRTFYRWMLQRQQAIHANDVAAVNAKKEEARRILAEDMPRALEFGLRVHQQGIGKPRDILVFGLGPQDYQTLAHMNEERAWVDAALEILATRFGAVPTELADRVRSAASEHDARSGANASQ